jgi:hypothetical protein
VFPTSELQLKPVGQVMLMLKVVLESPTLFTPTVKMTEFPTTTLEPDNVDEAARLAGDKIIRPVCSVSDKLAFVSLSFAVTLAVIWLE